jgi:hypothetical protein
VNASTNDSSTPLRRKLGVEDGSRVAVLDGPDGFAEQLEGARVSYRLGGRFALIIYFATSHRALERRLPRLLAAREEGASLWIAWPKRSSGVASDLDDSVVRHSVLATGLVDNKVCAIDETWSGLRFVARRGSAPQSQGRGATRS